MSEHGVSVPKNPTKRPKWREVEPRPQCPRFPKQEAVPLFHPAAPLPDESKKDRRKRLNKAKRVRKQQAAK